MPFLFKCKWCESKQNKTIKRINSMEFDFAWAWGIFVCMCARAIGSQSLNAFHVGAAHHLLLIDIASVTQTLSNIFIYWAHSHIRIHARARLHTNAISSSQTLQNKEKNKYEHFFYNQNHKIREKKRTNKLKSNNLQMHNIFGGKLIKRFFFALLLIT